MYNVLVNRLIISLIMMLMLVNNSVTSHVVKTEVNIVVMVTLMGLAIYAIARRGLAGKDADM